MLKLWTDRAWNDYLYWQTQNKQTLKKLNRLIKDIERNGYDGLGKPEPLTGSLTGWWSRRIDATHRIVYRLKDGGILEIAQCKGHYHDK
jgi:toxin YoeB